MKIEKKLLGLRDVEEADIPILLDYWYRSPAGYIESIGVDPQKCPNEEVFKAMILQMCRDNQSNALPKGRLITITYDNVPIGGHSLSDIKEGDSAIFHAHLWDKAYRGRGVAMFSYPRACKIFLERFNLKKIVFKTPVQNLGAIRVKEKLGMRCVGEEVISFGIVRDGTVAKVFEVTGDELEAILETAR